MTSRALTGYQLGLGVLCALGLGLAIWLTSTDPTISYSTSGEKKNVEVNCTYSTTVDRRTPGTSQAYTFQRGFNALMRQARRDKEMSAREILHAVNVDCARAERARLRTVVWVLAGVLAVGVVLMGTFIVRISRRRHVPAEANDREGACPTA